MKYRPEFQLDRIRMMMMMAVEGVDSTTSDPVMQERNGGTRNCWLRTIVLDLSRTSTPQLALDQLMLQQRAAVGCAVERVVCRQLNQVHLSRLLPFVTQSVPLLISLDLCCRFITVDDECLLRVAAAHSTTLRRLCLPPVCSITQSTLEHFTQLEELDASGCVNLTNVDFCSTTLRVLYANGCKRLTNQGLRNATRLKVLHVDYCRDVTEVAPFAHCLLELSASGYDCGIGATALSRCRRLQALNVFGNGKASSVPDSLALQLKEINDTSSFCPSD